jgi:trehalose/maltose transport system substrate-binding protein
MSKLLARLLLVPFAVLLLPMAAAIGGETIRIACPAVGIEYELCREGADAWAQQTGNSVELIQTPNLADERLALFQQLLSSESPDIDVMQIDVIWPGILGQYFADLGPLVAEEERAQHFPPMLEANTVDGQLKALPLFGDAGLLYYRKDLLEKHGVAVPQTWDELAAGTQKILEAERAAGNSTLVGFVFQGRAYEGLTCNALEWIASFGGGTIIDGEGNVTLNNPQAVAAIDTVAKWIGTVAPEGVLTYSEEEARGAFQSGNAIFMRNWPYAWALANAGDSPIAGKVGMTVLPKGPDGRNASTLGGGGIAVSKFSAHPALAADLARHLTSRQEQIRRAVKASLNPTIPAAYDAPELLEAQPAMKELLPVLTAAVPRPARIVGEDYNRISSIFWNAVHEALSGNASAADALADAAQQIERLKQRGGW